MPVELCLRYFSGLCGVASRKSFGGNGYEHLQKGNHYDYCTQNSHLLLRCKKTTLQFASGGVYSRNSLGLVHVICPVHEVPVGHACDDVLQERCQDDHQDDPWLGMQDVAS